MEKNGKYFGKYGKMRGKWEICKNRYKFPPKEKPENTWKYENMVEVRKLDFMTRKIIRIHFCMKIELFVDSVVIIFFCILYFVFSCLFAFPSYRGWPSNLEIMMMHIINSKRVGNVFFPLLSSWGTKLVFKRLMDANYGGLDFERIFTFGGAFFFFFYRSASGGFYCV